MNIENFSTTNLPGLADLGDTKNYASIKGDDPGPKGPIGPVGCSATGVGSGNLTSTTSNLYIPSTGIYINNITVNFSNVSGAVIRVNSDNHIVFGKFVRIGVLQ